jgi:hypothetical protein
VLHDPYAPDRATLNQGEPDELLSIGREPAQVIEFLAARVTLLRLVNAPVQP